MRRTCLSKPLRRGAMLLGCLLLAAAPPLAAEDARHTLRYRFTPGDSAYFLVANSSTLLLQQGEVSATIKHGNDTLKHFRVLSVAESGDATLELTIDRTRMFAEQGPTLFTYDSAVDKSPPEAFGGVAETIGRPWMHVTISPRGVVLDQRRPNESDKLKESGDLLSAVLPLLPEQPVAVGETWKEPFIIGVREGEQLRKPIKLQRVYTLARCDGDEALVEFTTQILTPLNDARQQSELLQKQYSGEFLLDLRSGRLLSRELRVDESVVGYEGPQSSMGFKVVHRDAYAPAGADTPLPARPTGDGAERTAGDAPSVR